MFSTKEYIAKKTGPFGIGRLPYLQELVDEFQSTDIEGIENFEYHHHQSAAVGYCIPGMWLWQAVQRHMGPCETACGKVRICGCSHV